jgi:hypothetical protein
MAKNKMTAISPLPTYSLDLAPCNFSFPVMKLKLKGKIFNDALELQKNSQQVI